MDNVVHRPFSITSWKLAWLCTNAAHLEDNALAASSQKAISCMQPWGYRMRHTRRLFLACSKYLHSRTDIPKLMETVRGCRILCFLVIFVAHFAECRGVWWTAGGPLMLQPRRICRKVHAIGGELQKNICRRDRHLLKEIVKGVEIGMDECQFQLRYHRWNCTTRRRSLGKMLLRDTKEAAFVHATTASAVAHVVASACGKGRLKSCTCHQTRRYRAADGRWFWGGCGDNFDFGYQKSLEFMDFGSEPAKDVRAKILRHNNEVGRLAIKNQIGVKCKCHGLSASCEMKTCWPKMAPFRQTGDVLLHKFKAAKPVTPDNSPAGSFLWLEEMGGRKSGNYKRNGVYPAHDEDNADAGDSGRPTSHLHRRSTVQEEVLVYTDSSPNLCKTNRKIGILGTQGRQCNGTASGESAGSCDYLCCGRGYVAEVTAVESNCHCRFQWCCEVVCERCAYNMSSHYCA